MLDVQDREIVGNSVHIILASSYGKIITACICVLVFGCVGAGQLTAADVGDVGDTVEVAGVPAVAETAGTSNAGAFAIEKPAQVADASTVKSAEAAQASQITPPVSVAIPRSQALDTYIIQNQQIPFSYALNGIVQADQTTPITVPVSWKPVRFVVPNGSYIKKDEVVAEFDPLYQDKQYEKMLLEKKVVDLDLDSKLIDIDDQSQKMEDQIKGKEGSLKVLQAKQKRIQSLPLLSDVTIAKGKLRIAQLELDGARVEWDRAQERFAKHFLSKTELQSYQYTLRRKQNSFDYAKDSLVLIEKPADAWETETLSLQIKNLQIEIEKLKFAYSKQKDFISINKNSAMQGAKRFERKLKNSKEDLDNLIVRAPQNGYVVYTDDFKRALSESGGKMSRRRIFVNIPHSDGMYIHATVPEHLRQLINLGDSCDIYIPGISSSYIKGEISSIENQPKDIMSANGEHSWGSHDKDSGIKVYIIKIKPTGAVPNDLKPQSHVEMVLHGKPREALAIPANYVVCKDENYYISRGGIYEQVDGVAINGWFQLKDQTLLGKTIGLKGEFPISDNDDNIIENASGQLVLSGEVSAISEYIVRVQDIYHSAKITELAKEGATVKKGDLLIKLDDTDTKEELNKREDDWKTKVSEREREEEEIKITKQNGEIDVKHAENDMRIAALSLDKSKNKRNDKAILDQHQRFISAQINLEESQAQLDRLLELPQDRVSQTELTNARRDTQRKTLQLEQSQIQLDVAKNDVDALTIKSNEKDFLEKRLSLENLNNRLDYDLEVAKGSLIRRKYQENQYRHRYDQVLQELENLNVMAPVAGVVQYKVIWDSGELGKIKKGSTLRDHLSPISIADFSQTMVSLEVPEQAFTYVKKGDQVKVQIPSLGDHEFKGFVSEVEYIFKNKTRKDVNIGLYANREPLGQAVFIAQIHLNVERKGLVKPGMQVHVHFPISWPLNAVTETQTDTEKKVSASATDAQHAAVPAAEIEAHSSAPLATSRKIGAAHVD